MDIKHKITGKVLLTVEGANLRGADLQGANLQDADLQDADLQDANLQYANLRGANLRGANLQGADLQGADLQGADLQGADLRNVNLQGADLRNVNLRGANLRNVNLRGANMQGADLQGADLQGADLRDADLNFSSAAFQRTRILPEGSLVGWKTLRGGIIAKLQIKANTPRSHAFGRKCRAKQVTVIDLVGLPEGVETAVSMYDGVTEYKKGSIVKCHEWDDNWQNECTGGIHFFITRAEAEAYQ